VTLWGHKQRAQGTASLRVVDDVTWRSMRGRTGLAYMRGVLSVYQPQTTGDVLRATRTVTVRRCAVYAKNVVQFQISNPSIIIKIC
jgi:hypothetical protein